MLVALECYLVLVGFRALGRRTDSPITLLANDALLRVARPKSPIFTDPVGPVMKILSHLRSRWMMGGVRV